MAAKLHFNYPGVTQLVQQQARKGELCFYVDKDYQFYLDVLHTCAVEFNCHIHAYALMPAQTLLLVTPYSDAAVSKMMHALTQQYAAHINKTYGRSDALWQGGYTSCLLQSEQYLIDCMRYIEFMPVRQNPQLQLQEYVWSSYRSNALNIADTVITPHSEYQALSDNDAERVIAYKDLLKLKMRDEEDIEEISAALVQQGILGSSSFRQQYTLPAEAQKAASEYSTCVMCY